jgi:hypothetical protein
MYINSDEIAAVKAKVQANEEPWKSAYNTVISAANSALSAGPYSVTYGGAPYYQGCSPHLYYADFNAGRVDYYQACYLSKALRNLGMAYAFTGNSNYAERAIYLIRVWCLDSDTWMYPQFTGGQSRIELFITMPGMFYGADLIYNYPGWDETEKASFLDWVQKIVADTEYHGDNNFDNWQNNFIASAGALLDNYDLMKKAFDLYRYLIPRDIDSRGEMINEHTRERGITYSVYAINAMTQCAEIARHRGINLYDYTCDGSIGLKLAADYHTQYVINPGNWPYSQSPSYDGQSSFLYELTYSYWQDSSHLNAVNRWGRPLEDIRVMGWATLTHGNMFELNLPQRVDTPVVDPPEGMYVRPVAVSMSCNTDGAAIRYTTDGSEPDSSSTEYISPFTLTESGKINIKAFKDGMLDSYFESADYIIGDNSPTFTDDFENWSFAPGKWDSYAREYGSVSATNIIKKSGNYSVKFRDSYSGLDSAYIAKYINGSSYATCFYFNLASGFWTEVSDGKSFTIFRVGWKVNEHSPDEKSISVKCVNTQSKHTMSVQVDNSPSGSGSGKYILEENRWYKLKVFAPEASSSAEVKWWLDDEENSFTADLSGVENWKEITCGLIESEPDAAPVTEIYIDDMVVEASHDGTGNLPPPPPPDTPLLDDDTDDIDDISVKVYPSPYSPSRGSSMRFSIDGTGGGEVKIYTISGKLVKKLVIQSGISEANWDVLNEEGNSITTGLYLYTITDSDGGRKIGKIAIAR